MASIRLTVEHEHAVTTDVAATMAAMYSETPGSPVGHTYSEAFPPAAAEAVDRILASTEVAVASIVRRTEHGVHGMAAELDTRIAREAISRAERIAALRRDLTERASLVAAQFDAILAQLDAAEAALAPSAGRNRQGAPGQGWAVSPVTGMRVTLRERQRVNFAYEQVSAPPPDSAPAPVVSFPSPESRRRWWRPWARQAA